MIKLIVNAVPKSRTTTLNDIPVGETFQGEIVGKSGSKHRGLFFKAVGCWTSRDRDGNSPSAQDVVVVQLDGCAPSRANIFTYCRPVNDYEPVDIVLTVNPK